MINIKSLCKIFKQCGQDVTVLSDVELKVNKGECVVIEGPSGSGKTTLLNTVGCLTRPTRGEIFINDKRISHLPEHFLCELRRSKIGFIFQQFNLLAGFTAVENVGMPLVPLGVCEAERRERACHRLDFLGLGKRADVPINKLSGGEQQRVAIARALMNDPELIIADEPVSNVDAATAEKIAEIFKELIDDGKTILVTSHDPLLINRLPVTSSYELVNGRLS